MSLMDVKSLAKGLTVVGLLSGMMTAMVWATRGASDCKKNLIVMTAAIAVMATVCGGVVVARFIEAYRCDCLFISPYGDVRANVQSIRSSRKLDQRRGCYDSGCWSTCWNSVHVGATSS